jgi:hypothetical protein
MSDTLNGRTITAANSRIYITVPGVYNTPQRLQGFTADDVFTTEALEPVETVDGVDGYMSVGWIYRSVPMDISLMPDSPSVQFFEDWASAQQARREVIICSGTCVLPGPMTAYSMPRGALIRVNPIPSVRRVLQGRTWRIQWSKIDPAPYTFQGP